MRAAGVWERTSAAFLSSRSSPSNQSMVDFAVVRSSAGEGFRYPELLVPALPLGARRSGAGIGVGGCIAFSSGVVGGAGGCCEGWVMDGNPSWKPFGPSPTAPEDGELCSSEVQPSPTGPIREDDEPSPTGPIGEDEQRSPFLEGVRRPLDAPLAASAPGVGEAGPWSSATSESLYSPTGPTGDDDRSERGLTSSDEYPSPTGRLGEVDGCLPA